MCVNRCHCGTPVEEGMRLCVRHNAAAKVAMEKLERLLEERRKAKVVPFSRALRPGRHLIQEAM